MKNFSIQLISVPLLLLLFTQCKKETSPPEPNFSPLTPASTWTYKYVEGNVSGNFTLTVTNRDTIANGKKYKVLTSSDGSNSYLGKVGNDYYRFATFPSLGINSFEELYLKDNKLLDETWTGTTSFKYLGTDITANLNYTIKAKGISRTVNTLVFNNVTRVRLDISIFGAVVGGGDFYYQEGVGLIDDSILVSPPGFATYSSTQQIVSYSIK